MKDYQEAKPLCVDTFAFLPEHSGKGPASSPDVLIESRCLPPGHFCLQASGVRVLQPPHL